MYNKLDPASRQFEAPRDFLILGFDIKLLKYSVCRRMEA